MGFRLANINDRAALVDDTNYYDIAEASGGALGPDPLDAVADVAALHALGARLNELQPSGSLGGVTLGPPIPRPMNAFAVGLNYGGHVARDERDRIQAADG